MNVHNDLLVSSVLLCFLHSFYDETDDESDGVCESVSPASCDDE